MKKILLFFLALICTTSLLAQTTPPNNQIWYTTNDGKVANIVSNWGWQGTVGTNITNTYSDGKGVITFGQNVQFIMQSAFKNCTNLTSVTLPSTITSLNGEDFSGCVNLTTVNLNEGLTTTAYNTFCGCTSLANITLPSTLTNIAASMFNGCKALTTITIPASVTEIDDKAFASSGIQTITIPATVTTFGENIFDWCDKMTSCTLSQGITTIPSGMFWGCEKLSSLSIPSSVTTISANVFAFSGISSITIPSSVTSIGSHAFWSSSLSSITFEGTTVPSVAANAFDNTSASLTINYPASAVCDYKDVFGSKVSGECNRELAENADPTSDLTNWKSKCDGGKTMDITISRTFYCDGYYNSLCLPFSLSATELDASPLKDFIKLKKFISATVDGENLNIVLEEATSIEAGQPYLIAWAAGSNIVNPKFEGVKVSEIYASAIATTEMNCQGNFAPVQLTANDKSVLFLGANDMLYWPSTTANLKGFRAYFKVNNSSAPIRRGMNARIVEQTATPTSVANVETTEIKKIFINGQLQIVAGEHIFNAMGQEIR